MEQFARERVKWLHGGQAEALAAWALRGLSDDWHVFNKRATRVAYIDLPTAPRDVWVVDENWLVEKLTERRKQLKAEMVGACATAPQQITRREEKFVAADDLKLP